MTRIDGRLAHTRAAKRRRPRPGTDFTGWSVAVYYTADIGGGSAPVERRFAVRTDGAFQLRLDSRALADAAARLAVLAPSGELVAAHALSEVRTGETTLRALAVDPPTGGFRPTALGRAADAAWTFPGRLLVVDGTAEKAGGLPVRIEAEPAAGAEGAPPSVWSGVTDRDGYFTSDLPDVAYRAARVLVGTGTHLTVQDIVPDTAGHLPRPLIVVLAARPHGTDDCTCDTRPPATPDAGTLAENGSAYSQDLGAACQAMTVPNRTLEEFGFYQIVRTTDPSIRGLTLPDDESPPVAVGRAEMSKLVFDAGTLSQVTGVSDLAAQQAGQPVRAMNERERTVLDVSTNAAAVRRASGLGEALRQQISITPLTAAGTGTSAIWREAGGETTATGALDVALTKIPSAALLTALADPDGFTPDKVMTLERRAGAAALRNYLRARASSSAGRAEVDGDNPVDWDHTPEFYQATSVAHGHVLHFKQEWRADGYSLGDLVQSIPLAPGQRKQIVTLDWDRGDRATRSESTLSTEELSANLSRDRDINEIANAGFRESLRGSSSANVSAVGGGLGLAIGPLVIGGGGGSSWASSTASSDSARSFTAQSLQQLNDQTSQSAAAVRNQRSTVVQGVGQSEQVGAVTEVISNFNRCHALTIQYFEVLRHFAVQERLAGVSECLFVPLEMSLFDDAKTLRWREILQRACPDAGLRAGFDAIERLSSPATTPPDKRYADDPIEEMSGRLRFRVSIARPKDPDEASRAVLEQTEWGFLGLTLRVNPETLFDLYRRNDARKDEVFRREIAPGVAREFLSRLQVVLIDRDGHEHPAGLDPTVTSRYQEDGLMEVVLDDDGSGGRLPRSEIAWVEFRSEQPLPAFSRVLLSDARITYRTTRITHALVGRGGIDDDVLPGDPATVGTGFLSPDEQRNQLAEDRRRRRRLIRHLNDNIEFYHRAIWLGMDPNRRYMLLDGFEAPNADGRSIASVVENRLLGIVGNALVMPVAPGFQLDPQLREILAENDDPQAVLDAVYAMPPAPPRRHSVPTKGVFGEAVPGTCVSCEHIDEDRFWRWNNYPLPDTPPAIAPLSTDSRFAAQGSLSPTPLPSPLIRFQDLPEAPAPTGMRAALEALGRDVFKDLTGLTQNQKNAMAALTASLGSAQAFAGEAIELALARDSAGTLDRTLGQISSAKTAGYLDDKQASAAARDALVRSFAGTNSPATKPVTGSPEVAEAIDQAAGSPGGSVTVTRENGDDAETVTVETPDGDLSVGARPVIEWVERSFWVSLPLVRDRIVDIGGVLAHRFDEFPTIAAARQAGARGILLDAAGNFDVTDVFGRPTAPAGREVLDTVQAGLDAGLLRPDPADATRFQIKVETRIGYPGRASSKATPRVARRPGGVKPTAMPLAVVLHGNATAWEPTGPARPVTLPSGAPAVTGTLRNVPNHEGYRYLQDHLAGRPAPVVTMSISSNVANATGSLVEMRARIVNATIRALRDEIAADRRHFLRDAVDFDRVALIGHSRGGEAVVRAHQVNAVAPVYRCRAVCSLAPTDFTGVTATDEVRVDQPDTSLLVLWGGLDGDVSGRRKAGEIAGTGSGLRIYDRSRAHKALVFAPGCTHNRFNNPVWRDEPEWHTVSGGVPVLALPTGVATEPAHEALLNEFVGAFCDLTLHGDATRQALFRNESRAPGGLPVVQQWQFGSAELVVDDFEAAAPDRGTRTLGAGMSSPLELTPLTPSPGTPAGSRDLHCSHRTQVTVLDHGGAGVGSSTLAYDLRDAAGAGVDMSGYHLLTLRLGQLYDPTSQATIDALGPPVFVVRLTDASGATAQVDSATVYRTLATPLARPLVKQIERAGVPAPATQMVLHTVAFDTTTLAWDDGTTSVFGDLTRITDLHFEFDNGAGSGELWIDSVRFVRR